MKRFAVLALLAVAVTSWIPGSAWAAPTPKASPKLLLDLAGGTASEKDLSKLFDSVGITATSVSVSAGLGSFSFVDTSSSAKVTKQVEYTVLGGSHTLALSLGSRREILGISLKPIGPGSSRPIPEARTLLLYPLGLLAIGWVVLRARRTAATR